MNTYSTIRAAVVVAVSLLTAVVMAEPRSGGGSMGRGGGGEVGSHASATVSSHPAISHEERGWNSGTTSRSTVNEHSAPVRREWNEGKVPEKVRSESNEGWRGDRDDSRRVVPGDRDDRRWRDRDGDRDDWWWRHREPDRDDFGLGLSFGVPFYGYPSSTYYGPTCTSAYNQGYSDAVRGYREDLRNGVCAAAYYQGYNDGSYSGYRGPVY